MTIEEFIRTNHICQYPLHSIGINSVAYNHEDAIKIIGYARDNVIPILGGDWLYYKNNEIVLPIDYGDGWYCNRKENESLKDYVYRSCSEAERAIRILTSNVKELVLFDICLDSKWMVEKKESWED